MQAQEASFVLNFLLDQIRNESKTTAKVIAAVPEDKRDYKPDPKSRSAMELAWHLAQAEVWFLESVIAGQFAMEGETIPADIRGIADVVSFYQSKLPALIERAATLPGEKLAETLNFLGAFNLPRVMYLNFLLVHSIHHRGQLAVYLRPMGSKVPSIYGGSADEPFEMGAQA